MQTAMEAMATEVQNLRNTVAQQQQELQAAQMTATTAAQNAAQTAAAATAAASSAPACITSSEVNKTCPCFGSISVNPYMQCGLGAVTNRGLPDSGPGIWEIRALAEVAATGH